MPPSDGPPSPPPEYRPHRAPDGADSSMRNLALAAVAIAAVVMGGVWALSGRHHAGVPVIEPDSRPLRIKPADPGGMQVPGADDALLSGKDGAESDKLAPPPEAPAPQALQQQENAPPIPPPAAPPASSDGSRAGTEPAPPVVAPAPPALPPVVRRPPAMPERPLPPPSRIGRAQVQLAALDSEAAANAAWDQLARRIPQLLAGRQPIILKAEIQGKTYWRLRTGGFADIAAATMFCGRVRAKGLGCAIASF